MKPTYLQIPRVAPARSAPQRKMIQGRPPGSRRTNDSLESQADVASDGAVRRLPDVARWG